MLKKLANGQLFEAALAYSFEPEAFPPHRRRAILPGKGGFDMSDTAMMVVGLVVVAFLIFLLTRGKSSEKTKIKIPGASMVNEPIAERPKDNLMIKAGRDGKLKHSGEADLDLELDAKRDADADISK